MPASLSHGGVDHPRAPPGGCCPAALYYDRKNLADGGGDLPHPDRGHRGRDRVRGRAGHVHLQHHAARLQPGLLRQGLPHLPHPLLGVPDHPGVHAQPLLHHLLRPPVRQAARQTLLLPLPAAGPRLRRRARRHPEAPQHQRDPGAARRRRQGEGGARLSGGEGDTKRAARANARQEQGTSSGGHLALLHHPGGVPERAGDRLPGGPVLPVRLQRPGDLRVRPLPVPEGGGVLRVAPHREDRVPGLHVRGERHLRGPQPGRAQPPGLEEDQGGRPRRPGSQEVHLRDQEEGHGTLVAAPQSGTDPVQRVCLRLRSRARASLRR